MRRPIVPDDREHNAHMYYILLPDLDRAEPAAPEPGGADPPGPGGDGRDDLVEATARARRDIDLLDRPDEARDRLHQEIGGKGGRRIRLVARGEVAQQVADRVNTEAGK